MKPLPRIIFIGVARSREGTLTVQKEESALGHWSMRVLGSLRFGGIRYACMLEMARPK